MKKVFLLAFAFLWQFSSYAQTNKLQSTGNAGIGTINPEMPLHILNGTATTTYPSVTSRGDGAILVESSNNALEFGTARSINARRSWILARHSDLTGVYGMYYSDLHLQPDIGNKTYYKGVSIGYSTQTAVSYGTYLAVNGKVGIGTTAPSEMLTVNGTIRAKEIKVESGWADYVFDENYKLMSLAETDQFIKKNKHLPGIPSEKEVKEEGVSLGEMNKKLLEKIEELTLHMIQQQEKIEQLEAKLEGLN
ncbi:MULTISPECIES: hypothetical protein [Olivibacter]|uniref:Uncharacterized protein n=1 Tax=Olivibacter oleidegradans TaxID=760123 RepID=A0ABV6HJ39_9SPHI|nr:MULTISPECIES: hypothetical protein [Olivibacter]QEL00404.1 hypothetical protein FKG96_06135 [Olivibacter sp. LS-1]